MTLQKRSSARFARPATTPRPASLREKGARAAAFRFGASTYVVHPVRSDRGELTVDRRQTDYRRIVDTLEAQHRARWEIAFLGHKRAVRPEALQFHRSSPLRKSVGQVTTFSEELARIVNI